MVTYGECYWIMFYLCQAHLWGVERFHGLPPADRPSSESVDYSASRLQVASCRISLDYTVGFMDVPRVPLGNIMDTIDNGDCFQNGSLAPPAKARCR
jgi:hypothetical protein